LSVREAPGIGTPQPVEATLDGVALWTCRLDADERFYAGLAATLSAEEHARAARFGTEALARRYVIGRAALRATLAGRLGIGPAEVPIVRGEHGRPRLAGDLADTLDFNVTHTLGVALIGHLERPGRRIGVDIEGLDRTLAHEGLARKFMGERERAAMAPLDDDGRRQAFLRLWTCKEAMSKATGDGLSAPFRTIGIDTRDGLVVAEGEGAYAPAAWTLAAVALPSPLIATVAIWDRARSLP